MTSLTTHLPETDVVVSEAIEPSARLWLDLEGASPEDLARGVAAAERVFAAHGVTAEETFRAQWIVEGWDIDGFPEPAPERELAIHDVLFEAGEAAVKACRPRWPKYLVQLHRDRLRLASSERKAA